jgi:HK97 family phage prohead protease
LKKFKFEIKEWNEDGTFIGIASMYGNVDLGGDIVEKGAFTKTMQEKTIVPILWQHKTDIPLGIGELEDSDKGLLIRGKLNLEVEKAREAYSLIKQGAVKGLSIGYDVIKEKYEKGVRLLKELRLWEVSLVTFPMNTLSTIVDVKENTSYNEEGEEYKNLDKKQIQLAIDILTKMLNQTGVVEDEKTVEDILESKNETKDEGNEINLMKDVFDEIKQFNKNREEK